MESLLGGSAASGVNCFPGDNLQFAQCLICVHVQSCAWLWMIKCYVLHTLQSHASLPARGVSVFALALFPDANYSIPANLVHRESNVLYMEVRVLVDKDE